MTRSVEQVIRDHGMTPENVQQYVARGLAYNRKEIARDIGLSPDTVFRYKREFKDMDTVTRLRVTAWAAAQLHNELADGHLELSERSEADKA